MVEVAATSGQAALGVVPGSGPESATSYDNYSCTRTWVKMRGGIKKNIFTHTHDICR